MLMSDMSAAGARITPREIPNAGRRHVRAPIALASVITGGSGAEAGRPGS
jgi:hypothetical protein